MTWKVLQLATKPVSDDDSAVEIQVSEFVHGGVTYFTDCPQNGELYAVENDGEPSEEPIGCLRNGKPALYI